MERKFWLLAVFFAGIFVGGVYEHDSMVRQYNAKFYVAVDEAWRAVVERRLQ